MEMILRLILGMSLLMAQDPLAALRERYAHVSSLEAIFTQKIYIPSLNRERELEGKFLYKKGRGFVWKYERPEERIYLYDGSFLWEESKKRPYVFREELKGEGKTGVFLDLVEDMKRIDELFELRGFHGSDTGKTIELLPKRRSTIQAVRLELDQFGTVKRVEMEELGGGKNVIEFVKIRENVPIRDELFLFNAEGKEIRARP